MPVRIRFATGPLMRQTKTLRNSKMLDPEITKALNALAASMGRARFTKWLKKNHSSLFPYQDRDRLVQRAELAARIAECAINGRIQIGTAGRD